MFVGTIKRVRSFSSQDKALDLRNYDPEEKAEIYKKDVRQTGFSYSVIALGTRLAMADGEINQKEKESFVDCFAIKGREQKEIEQIISSAKNDKMPFGHYALLISNFYPDNQEIYENVLSSLIKLAACDGPINYAETMFICDVAELLCVAEYTTVKLLSEYFIPKGNTPYEILNVSKKISAEELKKIYRAAVQAYHPDKFSSMSDNEQIINMANKRINLLTDAYENIKRIKKF